MKKMTPGNRILAMLLAFVMILTGIAPGTSTAQVVKAAGESAVYFEYSDGRIQNLDDNDTITLKTTDKGYFKGNGVSYWDCEYRYEVPDHPGNYAKQILIRWGSGEFNYNSAIGTPQGVTAQAQDAGERTIKTFKINIVEEVKLDTSALDGAISEAEAKNAFDYTQSSWDALASALEAAKEVQAKEDATQTEVDQAATTLQSAIQALEAETNTKFVYFEYADGTKSRKVYSGDTLTLKLTDAGTFRLNGNSGSGNPHWSGCMDMDTGALIILGKVKTSSCTVNAYDWSFRIKFTVRLAADTDALEAAIKEGDAITNDGYTSATWSNFGIALINAKEMLNGVEEDGTLQSNVDAAATNLKNAIAGLKKEGELDFDALNSVISEAEAKQEENYTEDSWAALQNALTAAKTVLTKSDATQTEVDQAAADLRKAIDDLVLNTVRIHLEAAIKTAESKNKDDYTASSWSAMETALKEAKDVDANKNSTQIQIDAAVTKLTGAIEALEKKSDLVVYFQRADGTRVDMDENGGFTLKTTDNGTFKAEGKTDVYWDCSSKVTVINPNTGLPGGTRTHYWIKYGTGAFDGSAGTVDNVQASVVDAADKVLKTFSLKVVSDKYAELKAYVGDTEVTTENPYHVKGTEGTSVTIKGRKDGEDSFETIDPSLLTVQEENTNTGRYNRVTKQYFVLTENTKTVFKVSLTADNSVSTAFALYSDPVAMQDFSIRMPSVWYIDAWNGLLDDQYAGIMNGSGDNDYSISFTPYNTGNQTLIWKNLTPEIAEYSDEVFSNGIVPKKAGVAKFEVSSAQNPEIKHEVSVEFRYKTPLTAAHTNSTFTLDAGASQLLEMSVVPNNATEQRFSWSYSEDGIVTVSDSVHQDQTNVNTPKETTHRIKALKAGVVTVTGTPIDQSGNCEPVVFTVKVNGNGQTEDKTEVDKIVSDGIEHAASFLNSQGYKYECSGASDWYLMSKLRTGQTVSDADKEAYYQSAAGVVAGWNTKTAATDIARVALTLSAMGKDITDVEGVNLAELIYNNEALDDFSNNLSWSLLALDATSQKIPADAKWSRDAIIESLLTYQNETSGGFGWADSSWTDVDMTAMILQALAPYTAQAKVQSAVEKGLAFIKNAMDESYGYTSSETAAQVIMALACLKLDPIEAGFATETAGVITALDSTYRVADGGYAHAKGGAANAMASYQTMEAFESYRRYKAGEEGYWNMDSLQPSNPDQPEKDEQAEKVIHLIAALPAVDKLTLEDQKAVEAARAAYNALTEDQKAKVENAEVLVKAEAQIKALQDAKNDDKKDDSNNNNNNNDNNSDNNKPSKPTKPEVKKPAKVVFRKAAAGKKKVTLTWKKVKGATGYQVYRATSKKGKYTCVKKNLKAVKYTDKKLKKGKTYYYKVRAYKKVNGKTIVGTYSAVRKVKVK